MKKYEFTAECKRDFDEFYKEWVHALQEEGFKKIMLNWIMKTNNDISFAPADVDCEIETDATLEEIISLMERVSDGHKMIRTLELKSI